MSTIEEIILGAAQRYGIDPEAMRAIGQIESGLRPDAQNPNSSAGGLFQFIDSTWSQYGRGSKLDPAANADAAGRYLADVQRYLSGKLGRAPTAGELYLGHQQGSGGAAKLLSNPNAPAASLVGADAVRLNGAPLNVSSAQFAQLWSDKINKLLGKAPGGGIAGDLVYRGQLAGADPQSMALNPVDLGQFAGTDPRSLQRPAAQSLADLFEAPAQSVKAAQENRAAADMTRKAALFGGLY